ncbi:hypothetical protein CGRA01v4_08021 [Colletotrichum graminicola]|nr:hypothetical protein CGRA01v4_08021 [Colletotrichum graminicola]
MRLYPTPGSLTDISLARSSLVIQSHPVIEDHLHLWPISHLQVACSSIIKPPHLAVALVFWYLWLVRINPSPSWTTTSQNYITGHMIWHVYTPQIYQWTNDKYRNPKYSKVSCAHIFGDVLGRCRLSHFVQSFFSKRNTRPTATNSVPQSPPKPSGPLPSRSENRTDDHQPND